MLTTKSTYGSHKTSVSLEDEFWDTLKEIARGRGMTMSELVGEIDATRTNDNLSSALRLFILGFYRSEEPAFRLLDAA